MSSLQGSQAEQPCQLFALKLILIVTLATNIPAALKSIIKTPLGDR